MVSPLMVAYPVTSMGKLFFILGLSTGVLMISMVMLITQVAFRKMQKLTNLVVLHSNLILISCKSHYYLTLIIYLGYFHLNHHKNPYFEGLLCQTSRTHSRIYNPPSSSLTLPNNINLIQFKHKADTQS